MKKITVALSIILCYALIFSACSTSSSEETTSATHWTYNYDLKNKITDAMPDDSWYKEFVDVSVYSEDEGATWRIATTISNSDAYVLVEIYDDVVDVIKDSGLNYEWILMVIATTSISEKSFTYTTSDCLTGRFIAIEDKQVTANNSTATGEDLHEYMRTH